MDQKGPVVAYYITPHGFGHAVRALEILRRLTDMDPNIKPIIISDIPYTLVEQNVGRPIPMRPVRLDVGLCQYDSIRFGLEKTLSALGRLLSEAEEIIERERQFLVSEQVKLIVSDIPFLPFDAARACGIPSIGISNFTWDWIYGDYAGSDPRWNEIISRIRSSYAKGSLFLRLPMHGDCSVFPRIEDVSLVARKSARSRDEIRSVLGLGIGEKMVLVSFSSLELDEAALTKLRKVRNVSFFYKSPTKFPLPGARAIDGLAISYVDAVAAADAVITKPGYGIVSDCLAHGAPMIYTDRGRFPEYDILVETIRRELTSIHIEMKDFLAGNWEDAIRRVLALPRKVPGIRIDGADQCVGKILEFLK